MIITIEVCSGHQRATWTGDPGWLSLPHAGDGWVHCGGWAVEEIVRVYHYGPQQDERDPNHSLMIRSTPEIIHHLVAEHGFQT